MVARYIFQRMLSEKSFELFMVFHEDLLTHVMVNGNGVAFYYYGGRGEDEELYAQLCLDGCVAYKLRKREAIDKFFSWLEEEVRKAEAFDIDLA